MLTLKDLQELKDPGPPPEKPAGKEPSFFDQDAYNRHAANVMVWNQWVKHRRCYLMAYEVIKRRNLGLGDDGYVALLVTLIEHLGLGESGRILSEVGLGIPPVGQ